MVEFADPYSSLASGITQGANLALTIDQVKRQRANDQYEKDLKQAMLGIEMANNKGYSAETRAQYFQPVANFYKKYQGIDIEPPKAENIDQYNDILKRGKMLVKDVNDGKIDGSVALADWGSSMFEFQKKGNYDSAYAENLNKTVLKGIEMAAEGRKAGKKIDPYVYEQFAVRELGMSPDGAKKLLQEKPELLNVPLDQLKSISQFEPASKLRNEFRDESKQFRDVSQSYRRIQDSAKNPSAAGDLALIFNYMKMLDPGSTVREGEFANAQNAGGIPDRVRAMYNKAISGERLSSPIRADFIDRSNKLYEGQLDIHRNRESEFRKLATDRGINPSQVILDYTVPVSASVKPGTVEDGYRFIGGDPSDPKNWKKM